MYRFTDQERDSESGLYDYGARLYDPVIVQFATPDSIAPDPYDPQLLNRYSYCRNNPLMT
jgi:RHS repeat-associated protein